MSKVEKLRILFVSARYLPSVGGTQIHAHEVATRLAKAGHHVAVLTVDAHRTLNAHEYLDGVEVLRVAAWPKNRDYYISPAVYRFVRQAKVDLVHCHGYYTFVGPLAMSAALRARVPYVLTFHGRGHSSFLRRTFRRPQELALRPLLFRAKRLIALTEREKEFYRRTLRLPESLFAVIPGGSDLAGLGDLAETSVDPDLIVSLGSAVRLKGHQKIIAALPQIAAVRTHVRLRICGDGPFAPELRRLARRLDVADRVEIRAIPFAQRQEFIRTIRRAALVISLSDSEAQGLAVLEAAFLGRPLLVASAPGLTELVEAGFATGLPPKATSGIVAKAVLNQLEQPRATTSVGLPTWDDCTKRLEKLYESVLREGRGTL